MPLMHIERNNMNYVVTEDSITVVLEGNIYTVYKYDDTYSELKQALESGKNESKIKDIYYKRYVDSAKSLLGEIAKKNGG
jgi:hypothetical protein